MITATARGWHGAVVGDPFPDRRRRNAKPASDRLVSGAIDHHEEDAKRRADRPPVPMLIPRQVLGGTGGRAVPLFRPIQLEADAAPGTCRDDRRMLHCPAAVGVERRVAVRADDAEIFQAVVVSDPIDVIKDERHPSPVPYLALPAELAGTLLDAFLVEPALQDAARRPRALGQQGFHGATLGFHRSRPRGVRVEVIRRQLPPRGPLLEHRRRASSRAAIEAAQCLSPRQGGGDCGRGLISGVAGWHERMFAEPADGSTRGQDPTG